MGCSVDDSACDDIEKPAVKVTIPNGFWIGQTEVTVAVYERFVKATGGKMPPEPIWLGRRMNPDWKEQEQPIVNVTWNEAQAFCKWMGGRLPTEAEWEYSARAGSRAARYADLESVAWYSDNSGQLPFDGMAILNSHPNDYATLLYKSGAGPHSVAQKTPNRWNIYDTLGNVSQWTDSLFGSNAGNEEKGGQLPTTDPQNQVLRGGAWSFVSRQIRVSVKGSAPRLHRSTSIGFRCICNNP